VADLSPVGRSFGDGAATGGRDRAQLILVGAFALAVMFVALALVMNAAIYTENLATRSESAGTADTQSFERATTTAAIEALEYANEVTASEGTSGYAELEANVSDAMETYYNVTRQQQARRGQLVEVDIASTTQGTNIFDNENDFRGPSGGDDWRLASNVDDTRKFRIDVDSFDTTSDDEFRVVANYTETWYLNVSHDATYEVGINDSGSYTACPTPGAPPFTIDVSAGTVGGTHCPALDLHEVPGPYHLEFENGSVAGGEYSVFVDEVESWSSPDSDDPVANEALYDMEVDLTYWTPELRYRTTIRVAPGETSG
jgi:hypothetical protein